MKCNTTLIAFTFSTECFSSRCHEVAWHGTAKELEASLRICAAQDAGAENPLLLARAGVCPAVGPHPVPRSSDPCLSVLCLAVPRSRSSRPPPLHLLPAFPWAYYYYPEFWAQRTHRCLPTHHNLKYN